MTTFIIIRLIYEAYFRFPHFKILKAEMKKWIRRNSEPIVTYQLELRMKKSSDHLVFGELWINEKRYKYQISRSDRKFAGRFVEKEILKLNIISEITPDVAAVPQQQPKKGTLVLAYTFKNKQKYISVKKIRDIENMKLAG